MKEYEIVIVGANGQLGQALQDYWPHAKAVNRQQLDITDVEALDAFDWKGIRVIVNAAAYTDVDGAEAPEGRRSAWMINAQSVANLARIAIVHDMTMVHVSSEYVFDGRISPHREDEPVSPLGVYAQSKAAGDIAISAVPKHYLIRTSWLIGDGPNFVRTMMNLAAKNISPKVVSDQIGRLTFTQTLVVGIAKLLDTHALYGIYNLSNGGEPVSWAAVTKKIFHDLGRDDLTVTGISTAQYFKDKAGAAPRPLLSTMDLSKIEAAGVDLPDWRSELAKYIAAQTKSSRDSIRRPHLPL